MFLPLIILFLCEAQWIKFDTEPLPILKSTM